MLALAAALPAAGQSAEAAEPSVRWRLDTTTPFVWQAVLEVVAPAPLPLVGPALVEPVPALDLQPLPAGSGIAALNGSDRYVIPVARYRLTARAAGRTALPEAHVTVAGTARPAGAVRLVVRPLPDPIAASRAVGDLDRSVRLRRLGTDGAELTVELTGSGSVPFVEHPPPAVHGGRMVDTAVEVDAAGARKRWRYRLRREGGGVLEAVVPALPYLRLPGGETALIAAETVTLAPPEAAGHRRRRCPPPVGPIAVAARNRRSCGGAPAARRSCTAWASAALPPATRPARCSLCALRYACAAGRRRGRRWRRSSRGPG